jgi:hypothetical protein
MENMDGCQLPNVPKLSEGLVQKDPQPFIRRFKRALAVPWNYQVKPLLKKSYRMYEKRFGPIKLAKTMKPASSDLPQTMLNAQPNSHPGTQQQQLVDQLPHVEEAEPARPGKLMAGDWVRVRSWEEIQPMLDPFKETRGCAFLEDMRKYCDTKQRVFKSMERFLDERDYKVKKVRGVILLENVICGGVPAFGRCDRSCFLFWREEWLEKIDS